MGVESYGHLMGEAMDVNDHPDNSGSGWVDHDAYMDRQGINPTRKQGDAMDYDANQSTQWRTQQEAKGNPKKI